MPITISKELGFDAGHRLLNHEGKCRHLHGHRYKAVIHVTAQDLDAVGRVIDFSVIKAEVGGWIDRSWDHGYIGQAGDPFLSSCGALGLKSFTMDAPPTAENMATLLLAKASALLARHGISVVGVVLWETPTSKATATPAGPGVVTP